MGSLTPIVAQARQRPKASLRSSVSDGLPVSSVLNGGDGRRGSPQHACDSNRRGAAVEGRLEICYTVNDPPWPLSSWGSSLQERA